MEDYNTIVTLISNIGFPIVVAGVLFRYLTQQTNLHHEREKGWQEALQNNTTVMHEILQEIKSLRSEKR